MARNLYEQCANPNPHTNQSLLVSERAPCRAFAGWASDGTELYRALLPAHVHRPTPLPPSETPPPRAALTAAVRDVPMCRDEMSDGGLREVRQYVRASSREGGSPGWVRALVDWGHRIISAASQTLEFPSPSFWHTSTCGVHDPPD